MNEHGEPRRFALLEDWLEKLKKTENLLVLLSGCLVVSFCFNIYFLYRVAYEVNDLTKNITIVPEVFKDVLANLKADLDLTLKPLNENLNVIKETVSNANLQEFQSSMAGKLGQISQAAENIKNLAEKDTLTNLANKVDGMKETLSKNLDTIYNSLNQGDTVTALKNLETKFDAAGSKQAASLDKLDQSIKAVDLQVLEETLGRKIDLVSSHLTEELQKVRLLCQSRAAAPATQAQTTPATMPLPGTLPRR